MQATHATHHGASMPTDLDGDAHQATTHGKPASGNVIALRARTHDTRPAFDFSGVRFADWNRDGMVASHFFNALSLFFPAGEKFFIHSVKCFSGQVTDPVTAAAVRTFIAQEASHSNQHRRYLVAMVQQGYDIDRLDIRMFACPLGSVKPVWRLAMTVAMEHFTASLSRSLLRAGTVDGDPDLTKLWHWHACEELEHQSVAMDVYRHAVGTGARAYWLRVAGALRVSLNFLPRLAANLSALLAQDLPRPRSVCYLQALRYLWGKPGVLRILIPDFIGYFRPSFHPDTLRERDRALIAAVRAKLEIPDAG
ncbi:metal-dependent hydrolase [Burkholderia cepacia]|uniref:metal-dependent hydrolase n=1 Tax=Burkholderia cepacia TaxID=292 RepID=UPI00069E45E0|nr:metal-dependent hydrolase [Burkholderia cepacia]